MFFAVGGWGRGYGNNGDGSGNGSTSTAFDTAALLAATRPMYGGGQSITEAFNFNQLDNGIRGLERGLCDGFYTVNNGINTVAAALQNCCCETQQNIANLGYQMSQGFCGVDKSIMQNSFQNQAGFSSLANQLSSCCCDIEAGQKDIQYAIAQSTNNIVSATDKNADRIINFLTQSELERLRNENEEYRSQLQIATQTSTLINQLMPVAKPAYITCSPYAAAMGFPTGYNYGYNGCGCSSCA